jgi:hypothetical protein
MLDSRRWQAVVFVARARRVTWACTRGGRDRGSGARGAPASGKPWVRYEGEQMDGPHCSGHTGRARPGLKLGRAWAYTF